MKSEHDIKGENGKVNGKLTVRVEVVQEGLETAIFEF